MAVLKKITLILLMLIVSPFFLWGVILGCFSTTTIHAPSFIQYLLITVILTHGLFLTAQYVRYFYQFISVPLLSFTRARLEAVGALFLIFILNIPFFFHSITLFHSTEPPVIMSLIDLPISFSDLNHLLYSGLIMSNLCLFSKTPLKSKLENKHPRLYSAILGGSALWIIFDIILSLSDTFLIPDIFLMLIALIIYLGDIMSFSPE